MSDTTTSRCSICNHPQRAEVENQLLQGVEYRVISAKWDGAVSTSSLSRHSQKHMQEALRDQARDTSPAPADLLRRMIDIADDARAARIRARDSGTPVQQTRASDLENRVLQTLLGQYGIDATSTAQALRDAEQLVRAVGRYSVTHPAVSADLIREIRQQGLEDFASQLGQIVINKNSHSLIGKATS
jgi:hypothetical protein